MCTCPALAGSWWCSSPAPSPAGGPTRGTAGVRRGAWSGDPDWTTKNRDPALGASGCGRHLASSHQREGDFLDQETRASSSSPWMKLHHLKRRLRRPLLDLENLARNEAARCWCVPTVSCSRTTRRARPRRVLLRYRLPAAAAPPFLHANTSLSYQTFLCLKQMTPTTIKST